jgi:hypothetical protein
MKQKPSSRRRRSSTKSVLSLPDLEHAKAAVLNSLNSADAKRGYRHAIDEFVDWYCSEPRLAFNRIVVLRYRASPYHFAQSLAFQQLHGDEVLFGYFSDLVHGADIGMIQGRSGPRLPTKAIQNVRILGQLIWKEFEGHVASQGNVLCLVDYYHPTAAQLTYEAVM